MEVKIGIICGTGFHNADILVGRQEWYAETPFGKPSDALIQGKLKDVNCVMLGRHGRHHTINPTNINYRANIWALREAGCTHILATTACGSLQEHIIPGDIVILDQFIDRTNKRETTFFDGFEQSPKGICHIPLQYPFCQSTREILIECAKELEVRFHSNGTTVTIEGPRFSTKAESLLFRTWNADVVNMTTVPEAVLAKEAGLSYANIALVTDVDCWKDDDVVRVDKVMKILNEIKETTSKLIGLAVMKISQKEWKQVIDNNKHTVEVSTMLS